MKFCFGDIVVVEHNLIGVVVKSWCPSPSSKKEPYHDVYVRYFNDIREYTESQMERYMVRHKYLSDEEIVWQNNAVNNNQAEYDEIYKNMFDVMSKQIREELELENANKNKALLGATLFDVLYDGEEDDEENKAYTRLMRMLAKKGITTLDDVIWADIDTLKEVYCINEKSLQILAERVVSFIEKHNVPISSKSKYYKYKKFLEGLKNE